MRAADLSVWGRPDGRTLKREGNFVESVNCQRSSRLAFVGCQESA